MKVLTTPAKIAGSLDWRKASGSVLSLNIHKDRIGLAVASHPSFGEGSTSLEHISLERKGRISDTCKQQLLDIVNTNKVCGLIVSWPLQDSGKMGAACGRVLFTLENILQNSNIITKKRPFCLWDGNHRQLDLADGFGRSIAYSRTPPSNKQIHKASEEQYSQDERIIASQVWDDFFRAHWPDAYRQQQRQDFVDAIVRNEGASSYFLPEENWEDNSAYVNMAVL
jgi:hypothetical protein